LGIEYQKMNRQRGFGELGYRPRFIRVYNAGIGDWQYLPPFANPFLQAPLEEPTTKDKDIDQG
jgi:hypothetical protein